MVESAVHSPAEGHPDHDWAGKIVVRAVPNASRLAQDLIHRWVDEIEELDFGNWPQSVKGHADGAADDLRLGQRRVDDAGFAELFEESGGDAKNAAAPGDVLAEDDDPVVG